MKKTLMQSIIEMVMPNRTYNQTVAQRVQDLTEPLFTANPTVDESKVNYYLARAMYSGTIITDDKGNKFGADMILGSAFAKPIVDSVTTLMMLDNPSISEATPDMEATVSKYLAKYKNIILKALRY